MRDFMFELYAADHSQPMPPSLQPELDETFVHDLEAFRNVTNSMPLGAAALAEKYAEDMDVAAWQQFAAGPPVPPVVPKISTGWQIRR